MEKTLPEYCVLAPDRHGGNFILSELSTAEDSKGNSFVIVPYVHPESAPIAPRFFRVEKTSVFDLPAMVKQPERIRLKSRTSKESYLRHVSALKKHIQLGNVYEINYCIEFFATGTMIEPVNVFASLCRLAKAPYSALVKLGDEYIISASPELFLKKEGDLLVTKPIKGTAPRDADPSRDQALRQQLQNSLKERTENVMAVDVARNDLSRLAQKGTVEVNRLYNIESFETVHQMVSTVGCKLKPGTSFGDILQAAFPMASMTGAPKISAMNLIDKHEDFERKFYSGTMGMVNEQGDFTLPVIIRSIFYNAASATVSIAVGGAITYLSDAENEYGECLLKAANVLKALNAELDQE